MAIISRGIYLFRAIFFHQSNCLSQSCGRWSTLLLRYSN
jgi:hypothetical protein